MLAEQQQLNYARNSKPSLIVQASSSETQYGRFGDRYNGVNKAEILLGKLNDTTNYVQFFFNGIDYGYITFDVSRNIGVKETT